MNYKILHYTVAVLVTVLSSLPGFAERIAYASVASGHQQMVTVSGKITDTSGEPLPGANVLEKGTTNGTTADVNGQYTINVSPGSTLIFSFIGYLPEELPVNTQTTINMALTPDIQQLDEVVVIGYGTAEKKDITGSIASVKRDELKGASINTFDQMLQGRVPGVVFNQASGAPGGLSSIRIRGSSSINAGNEPLYVIDGMPIINDDDGASVGAARGSSLNALASLNPDDIESMEVLKDASATAIYGARGANGVILVTTRRGKAGQSRLNVDTYYGVQQVIKKLDVLNAKEYAFLINEARYANGLAPLYDPATIGKGTDWQDEIFRTAPVMNLNLSATGGSEKTTYAISGSYYKQDGIIIKSDFERYSLRVNIDTKISDKFKLGNNLSVSHLTNNGVLTEDGGILTGAVSAALSFNPMLPVKDASGNYTYTDDRNTNLGNPVAEIMRSENQRQGSRMLGNLFAEYELIKGLTARVSLGADAFFNKENFFSPPGLFKTRASKGEASVGTINGLTWLNENTLTYKTTFNDRHTFDGVLGFTAQSSKSELVRASAMGFSNISLGYHAIQVGEDPQTPGTYTNQSGLVSYLGRINYGLDDKYLLTLTGRVDGSSKFGAGNKYGVFPSGAVAWRISEESFMQDISAVNDLKLRLSYGLTGNQEIPPNRTVSLMTVTETLFDDETVNKGFAPSNLANRNLKWETTAQLDIGLDVTIFNRVHITADYYQKKTSDLLVAIPVAAISGFTSAYSNIGDLENKGFEFAVSADHQFGGLKWTPSFNISFNKTTVLDLKGNDRILNDFGSLIGISGWQIVLEGERLGAFYGYVFDGIVQENENIDNVPKIPSNPNVVPGDRKYKDLTGDGFITDADKTIIGNSQPDFVFGFNNTFSYKGFDLNVFIQGSVGNDIANFNNGYLNTISGGSNNLREVAGNRWTPQNPSNEYPRASTFRTDVSGFTSTFVEDGSYVRVKNISLGYNFTKALIQKVGLNSLKLYVSGKNLFTITDYTGYDPELNRFANDNLSQGADYGGYPTTKLYTVGLNIGF
jgi:TonB-dependent starch-binding outer membrane protein SusC